MTESEAKGRLIELLLEKSVRTGTFQLSSGGTSDLYVDGRQTTLHAEGGALVARLIHGRLHPDVVAVGGETLGADPIACGIATWSASTDRLVHAFLVRKQAKGHGAKHYVEGMANVPPGSAVCIVEDASTTGASVLRAAARATEAGLRVVQCMVVVDRNEGAAEAVAQAGYTLESLVTRAELVP